MKLKSFLFIGAITVISSNVFGTTLNTSIDNIIKNQYAKSFLTEKVEIVIEDKKAKLEETNFRRFEGACLVNLSFDKNGSVPFLGYSKKIKSETSAKNENQKKMMQQYVALHESYHCEFSNIENPIQYGVNQSKINNYLKDIKTIPTINSISYQITLSENFSDVAAFISLIQEYGLKNKDLISVMKSIRDQREDFYKAKQGDHTTHFSLDELLKEGNLIKASEIKNPKDFKDFVLNISNFGTKKVFENNTQYSSTETISSAFFYSILIEATNIKAIEFGIYKDSSPWKNKDSKVTEIAKEFLKNVTIEKTNNANNIIEQVFLSADKNKEFFEEKTKDFLEKTSYFYNSFESKNINLGKYRNNTSLNLKF